MKYTFKISRKGGFDEKNMYLFEKDIIDGIGYNADA